MKQKFKLFLRKIAPFFLVRIAIPLMMKVVRSCKIQFHSPLELLNAAKKGPVILSLWHNRMAPILIIFEQFKKQAKDFRIVCLVSRSRDGQIVAEIIEALPKGKAIRIPAHGKHRAIRELLEECQKPGTIIIITPDGPRGPKYKAKPGTAKIAQEANIPIVPLSWTSTGYWELKSWDRFRIPKPFKKMDFYFGAPIDVAGISREEASTKLERALYLCSGEDCNEK